LLCSLKWAAILSHLSKAKEDQTGYVCFSEKEKEEEDKKIRRASLPADGASREEVDSLGQQTVLGVGPCAFLGNFRDSVLL